MSDLVFKGDYVVSESSSIIAETVQYGLNTFCPVFSDRWQGNFMEDYRDMVIDSKNDFLERLVQIENGDWRFPWFCGSFAINIFCINKVIDTYIRTHHTKTDIAVQRKFESK